MGWAEVLFSVWTEGLCDKRCSAAGLANIERLFSFAQLFLYVITAPAHPPLSQFGRHYHFTMTHAGLLLPTSSKHSAVCHCGSVDEFSWLPLPLSPKNLIRSAQGPNHFLSCLDCIYRRSVALCSPSWAFHNYYPLTFVYFYTPRQYLPSSLPWMRMRGLWRWGEKK